VPYAIVVRAYTGDFNLARPERLPASFAWADAVSATIGRASRSLPLLLTSLLSARLRAGRPSAGINTSELWV
jgi:hypothetical protein